MAISVVILEAEEACINNSDTELIEVVGESGCFCGNFRCKVSAGKINRFCARGNGGPARPGRRNSRAIRITNYHAPPPMDVGI